MRDLKALFRVCFIIGLLILFLSLFLNWYIIQIYSSSGALVAEWNYNPITEWNAEVSNDTFESPKRILIPFAINALFISSVALSGYVALFNDLEKIEKSKKENDFDKFRLYSYVLFFLISLNLYYVFAFPAFYLTRNKLYFPVLRQTDLELNVTYYYFIGPGYIAQLIGFICVFPYTLFYYRTVEKFQKKDHVASKVVKNFVQTAQEKIEFDKLIAQEKVKLKYEDVELEQIKLENKSSKRKRC